MRRFLCLISHHKNIISLISALLFSLSFVGNANSAPVFLKKDLTGYAAPPSATKKLALIPDNFRFSQKKNLLGRLYTKLRKVRSKDNAQQVSDAIEQLWLTSGSDHIDVLMTNALMAIEDKNFPKAVYILGKIIKLQPGFTEAWNKRATVYFLAEDYHNAMINLQQVLALDAKHFQAINGVANILRETGHKKAALKAYQKLLSINPHLQSAIEAVETLSRAVKGQKT